MRRLLLVTATAIPLALLAAFLLLPRGQRVDSSYRPRVLSPVHRGEGPRVLFDAAHHNSHHATGRYAPLADLLRADGYRVGNLESPLTPAALVAADVLVIANAAGGSNPQLLGLNLVPLRRGRRDAPAFTRAEIDAVAGWVASGGSLLLVADHHPFGAAAAELADALGVRMHGGFVEVEGAVAGDHPGRLLFSRANGLLATHPIVGDDARGPAVDTVMSFTGQSLDGPPGSELLRLPAGAVDFVRRGEQMVSEPAGRAQGLAFARARGRVVVLGEAAMLTAQLDDQGRPFGLQLREVDNELFARRVFQWLSREL